MLDPIVLPPQLQLVNISLKLTTTPIQVIYLPTYLTCPSASPIHQSNKRKYNWKNTVYHSKSRPNTPIPLPYHTFPTKPQKEKKRESWRT